MEKTHQQKQPEIWTITKTEDSPGNYMQSILAAGRELIKTSRLAKTRGTSVNLLKQTVGKVVELYRLHGRKSSQLAWSQHTK